MKTRSALTRFRNIGFYAKSTSKKLLSTIDLENWIILAFGFLVVHIYLYFYIQKIQKVAHNNNWACLKTVSYFFY